MNKFGKTPYKMFGDILNLLSKLTLTRLINWILSRVSYIPGIVFRKSVLIPYPVSISVEPTNHCNLQCPHCPSGSKTLSRSRGFMDFELYSKVIDKTARETLYLMLYFQGEPFMHKELLPFITYAHQKGMYVMTSTNAHFINSDNAESIVKSGLDKLIISLDGVSDEVYRMYRQGGDLTKVKAAVKALSEDKLKLGKKTPYIELQFLVLSHNEHQMKEAVKLCKDLGANKLVFKTAQLYDVNANSHMLPKHTRYSRYILNKEGKYTIKVQKQRGCYKMWHTAVITWEGDVVPCCYDKDAEYVMGNLKEQSFRNIWRGEKYKRFREMVLSKRGIIPMCSMCSEK